MHTSKKIVEKIQTSGLFADSKTFVDMPMTVDSDIIQQEFDNLPENPDKATLEAFVNKYFLPAGSDTEFVTPKDWKERPNFLEKIQQPELRQWAFELNGIWKSLVKKTIPDIEVHPARYSVLPMPHSFVVPGGRFNEMFYWDTYWANKGLILCEMTSTIKGMLKNFASLIHRLGYIPNFIRRYSLDRSQPPLLASMLKQYVDSTGDKSVLAEILPALDKEYAFWTTKRGVDVSTQDGQVHKLQRYVNDIQTPRIESYKEDIALLEQISTDSEKPFANLRAACESGWDFSSRWLPRTAGAPGAPLHTIRTPLVLPVDLNSFMYMMETSLAELHKLAGNEERRHYFAEQAEKRQEAMEAVFWNQDHGTWFDYDLELKEQIQQFYLSCAFPVYAGCHGKTPEVRSRREASLLAYLKAVGALDFPGGIPTSLVRTGQQWDFPNAWPPLVHAVVMGLARSQDGAVRKAAIKLAEQWLRSNYLAYKSHGQMFEKYDVEKPSAPGGLGEYKCQEGFGWTNGVVLDFIYHFREDLDPDFLKDS